jgi:hypothetical protein
MRRYVDVDVRFVGHTRHEGLGWCPECKVHRASEACVALLQVGVLKVDSMSPNVEKGAKVWNSCQFALSLRPHSPHRKSLAFG